MPTASPLLHIKALSPIVLRPCTQLEGFLSQDRHPAEKLGPCQATGFDILQHVGSGEEGLVLECRFPQSNVSVALKLFFQGQQPSNRDKIWPLREEALYYASCASHRAQYSDPSVDLPLLPSLPHTKWAQSNNQLNNAELLKIIKRDISEAAPKNAERDEILAILEKMCADGWIAFRTDIRQKLQEILSPHESQQLERFTGDVIIGIVKPFFKKEDPSGSSLERQVLTMLLMRAFGWKLRDVQDRNWINGYLVDGGDVDTNPLYIRHLERSWTTSFFRLMEQVKTQANEQQGTVWSAARHITLPIQSA